MSRKVIKYFKLKHLKLDCLKVKTVTISNKCGNPSFERLNYHKLSLMCMSPGGGNIRPAGHNRPAKANFFSFDFAFLTEMWPARH